MSITYAEEIAASYRESPEHHDAEPLPVCTWCQRTVGPDEDEVIAEDETAEHAACNFQRLDEDELRQFLDQIARDCVEKVKEYRSLHPRRSWTLEHEAGSLLARIERVIVAAAVR